MPPSPWYSLDRVEREWREDLLRFYKAVIEQRRVHGFQDKVSTPNAELIEQAPSSGDIKDVLGIRFDPQRVQELRELPSWRPKRATVQPVLSQSIGAVETNVKSLTIAQLKPILKGEGLCVSGVKALMQERIINRMHLSHSIRAFPAKFLVTIFFCSSYQAHSDFSYCSLQQTVAVAGSSAFTSGRTWLTLH